MKNVKKTFKECTGAYRVYICLDNCIMHHTGIAFGNLFDAVAYASGLTFERCMAECNHTENDVRGHRGYAVDVNLEEDMFGTKPEETVIVFSKFCEKGKGHR